MNPPDESPAPLTPENRRATILKSLEILMRRQRRLIPQDQKEEFLAGTISLSPDTAPRSELDIRNLTDPLQLMADWVQWAKDAISELPEGARNRVLDNMAEDLWKALWPGKTRDSNKTWNSIRYPDTSICPVGDARPKMEWPAIYELLELNRQMKTLDIPRRERDFILTTREDQLRLYVGPY
jgi:hypothetical protein